MFDTDKLKNFLLDNSRISDDEEAENLAESLIDSDMIVATGRWATGDEMTHYPRVPYKPFKHYCTACEHEALAFHDEEILTDCCSFCGARME